MKDINTDLSVKELEKLCKLYLECRLSVLEETELNYILLKTNKESLVLNETRKIMEIERKVANMQSVKIDRKPIYKKIVFYGSAASILLMISFLTYDIFKKVSNEKSYQDTASAKIECLVYSNGEKISGNEAISIAESHMRKMDDFEKKIQLHVKTEKNKVDCFMLKTRMSR